MRLVIESIIPLPIGTILSTSYHEYYASNKRAPFPDIIQIHPQLQHTLHSILHLEHLPWSKFLDPFQDSLEEKGSSEEDEDFDQINQLLSIITAAYNNGMKIDLVDVAKELGMPIEQARSVQVAVEKQFKKYGPSEEANTLLNKNPLKHVEKLSPLIRSHLQNPLTDSDLLVTVKKDDPLSGKEAVHLMKSLGNEMLNSDVIEDDFDFAVENLAYDYFEENIAPMVLNTIIYCMCKQENEWVSVKALCAFLIVNFEFPLIATYDTIEAIIEDISQFMYTSMCTCGLFELKERVKRIERITGDYQVKASSLFRALFSIQEL